MFPLPRSILPSVSDPVVEMWAKALSEFNRKYSKGTDCFSIHVGPCIVIMKSLVKVSLDSAGHLQKLLGENFERQFYLMMEHL